MTKYLGSIHSPAQLRQLPIDKLIDYCEELRAFIIESVLKNGGHFSANLGTVELATALHYVFDTPEDQLVWDVGHQAYPHKIITGRQPEFHTIRKKGGLSGFPKRSESDFDVFGTGHSSTSISAILGMAEADLLKGIDRCHIAVIGDGSLTAGMAWEALNNAGLTQSNILIVINDNHMGIDPNAGALNNYLENLQPDAPNFFSDLGLKYFGPDDGHDVENLVDKAKEIKLLPGAKIWHVKTVKGKGFDEAEKEQTKWHAVKYVKIREEKSADNGEKFQDVFGKTLLDLAKLDELVVGVTPAMPSGSSMNIMMKEWPKRVFDVGIAEQHAVTFSAGLAVNGMIVFCNIYSTFIQRAFDQVIHDVCLQNLPVIFCLDRSGVVGEDGDTHHGMYDIAFLRSLPNLVIAAPVNDVELRQMMFTAYNHQQSPFVIRYPKGRGSNTDWRRDFEAIPIGKGLRTKVGSHIALVCFGVTGAQALLAANRFPNNEVAVYNMRFAKPLDFELLAEICNDFETIITLEDGVTAGGFGSAVLEHVNDKGFRGNVHRLGFDSPIVGHGTRNELLEKGGLDEEGLTRFIAELLKSD